ncbi:uncharacterized protein MYCGRDRAFT_41207 [Zymoseptoria tritici IPO323]|uniref:Meiotically up-regulated protein Msb1/Mug8 domain-containing protein n=1 Tax=Zymoseptoria tritici (strain CBS 115943 / IPO323) TaxID=336722 RepID=F9X960_ZYMTI|nr:uncharacterized protein MYCGRDRAFT_41207 [Zymoseptoria tritici IPO323]EGP88128.1 hypothetical protein MYCGRDRAFT_41207 [Zymoseptoria tritici IPO323]
MPLFSRFKNKGAQPTSKDKTQVTNGNDVAAKRPTYQSRWESTTIVPAEVQELVHICTAEMKSRAEALDAPFFLLPFRPDSHPISARTFIRNYYKANAEGSTQYRGEALKQELRLTDSVVLCSIMKWCWSRMPAGVVTWPVYEGFRIGEKEADLARNAFNTFIPMGVDSEARRSIIFDFFDLLASVAAHGKLNGLGGRKLSRLAGWWAFEHSDDGKGFEGGYKCWQSAADACSHLFFAYLRSLSPDTNPSMNVIERIPRSLQALVASTEYPPETPSMLQRSTARVVMVVDNVSPTPFALLRRAKNFEYRDRDRVLREFAEFEDPIDALTEECKRVLWAISSTNQSQTKAVTSSHGLPGLPKPDESWSAFQNMGFGDIDERALSKGPEGMNKPSSMIGSSLRSGPHSRGDDFGRPTTPSWGDFLSSGFADDGKPSTLLYPPTETLPPLVQRSASFGRLEGINEALAPGELAAITNVELDDAFWWVWMTSLAGEEPTGRKAVFGRCALIETTIMNGKWLIMEEQVKGAAPDPAEGAFIAPKKSLFSFTKRNKTGTKESKKKSHNEVPPPRALSATPSKVSITTDQHAKIKAAARALTTQNEENSSPEATRRGRHEEGTASKTTSTMTVGLGSEAAPAMQWAKAYDKHAIRAAYLGDNLAGTGKSREDLVRQISSNSLTTEEKKPVRATSPRPPPLDLQKTERDLPAVPLPEPPVAAAPPPVHPATRAPAAQQKDPGTPKSATFLAAQAAMQSRASPPPQNTSKLQKGPTTNNAGLRKFFGKKTTVNEPPPRVSSQQASSLAPPQSENGISRRFSQMRKNTRSPPTTSPTTQSKPSNSAAVAAARAATSKEPVLDMSSPNPYPADDLSRTSTREEADAVHEFSRFDQGPLMDIPSAVTLDSEDDRSTHKSTNLTPDYERRAEESYDPQVVQDRWATIRENAHRRAKRGSEDQSARSGMSQSQRTDDGETSGEETIESRVARIKARVAELTGNMDSAVNARP